ncbi:MAG: DUF4215 domain-containing protein [Myxococcota bacterium]
MCGNGRLETGEECDDGNLVGGDGCSAECKREGDCGNGVVDQSAPVALEFNWVASNCSGGADQIFFYINGSLALSTVGDNGTCTCTPGVGNSVVTDPAVMALILNGNNTFELDYMEPNNFLAWATLTIHTDDGRSQEIVLFDQGGGGDAEARNPDLCAAGFLQNPPVQSADAFIQVAELCDDGNATNGDGCDNNCTATSCGNGIVSSGEGCDDGNTVAGDGCSATCTREAACGNGVAEATPVVALEFAWLATNFACTPSNIRFRVNGTLALTTTGDEGTCSCTPGSGTATVTDPAILSRVTNGSNSFSVTFTGTNNALAWATVVIRKLGGTRQEVVIFDEGGGGDAEARREDLCTAGFLQNPPQQSANATVSLSEQCDDGNTVNGDGCDNNCTVSACGNGQQGGSEQCDDGNTVNGDGCDNNCTTSACGNGIIAGTEQCEDLNTVNGDGCDNNCTFTACGNGIVTSGEACDDGNTVPGDGCSGTCTQEVVCGNGTAEPTPVVALEFNWLATNCAGAATTIRFRVNGSLAASTTGDTGTCSCTPGIRTVTVTDPAVLARVVEGNNTFSVNFQGTNNMLAWATAVVRMSGRSQTVVIFDEGGGGDAERRSTDLCAAGALQNPPLQSTSATITLNEPCDDGNTVNGDGCDNNCTFSACGNGQQGGSEQCDDGNFVDGDGCDSNCTTTACGNGITTSAEQCDDGDTVNGDGCDSNCTITACGNGIVTSGEACDDGNTASGDGCSAGCQLEAACGNGQVEATPVDALEFTWLATNCSGAPTNIRFRINGSLALNTVGDEGFCAFCFPGIRSQMVTDPAVLALVRAGSNSFTVNYRGTNNHLGWATVTLHKAGGTQTVVLFDEGGGSDAENRNEDLCAAGAAQNPAPATVNASVVLTEACDDGNTVNGDGCDNNCTVSACGNGQQGGGEQCDDGNTVNGDGCDTNCTLSACGNGVAAPDEGCDDGNLVDGDGCDSNCTVTACGNGILTSGEACDDGNTVGGDGCSPTCGEEAVCGNGTVETTPVTALEFLWLAANCNFSASTIRFRVNDTPAASSAVGIATCSCTPGIGSATVTDPAILALVQPGDNTFGVSFRGTISFLGWAVALVHRNGTGAQEVVIFDEQGGGDAENRNEDICSALALQDATLQTTTANISLGESCDDGNAVNGDGCDVNCSASACGNGLVGIDEECDDSNLFDGDGCDSNCTFTACGNNVLTDNEECDDGNNVNGDGCTADCSIE